MRALPFLAQRARLAFCSKWWPTLRQSLPAYELESRWLNAPIVAMGSCLANSGPAEVQTPAKSLDIGCGRNKTSGCIGIDKIPLPGVDFVHDLDQFPWPFPDDEFSVIYANHFLEHVSHIVETLREIHRICLPGGRLFVRVPHYASDNFHTDLTHKVAFGYRSFDHFSINGKIAYDFYAPFRFEILRRRIKFMSPLRRIDPFRMLGIEAVVNRFPRIYERFFVYLLPPVEIQFELRIVK